MTKTEAWGRRLLSTQLASWAELRHDTLLYAKQSYTGGDTCEFPDAYVDPYPAFYARIAELAQHGVEIVGALDLSSRTAARGRGCRRTSRSSTTSRGRSARWPRTSAPGPPSPRSTSISSTRP